MKKLFMPLLLMALAMNSGAENLTYRLQSPDGHYTFTFTQEVADDSIQTMYYDIRYKGKEIVKKSRMGVVISNRLLENALAIPNDHCQNWGDNLVFIGADSAEVHQEWQPLYGEQSTITDHYKQLALKFRKGEAGSTDFLSSGYDRSKTYYMTVEIRAYNEGVAFRYHFPPTSNGLFLHITGEQTQFSMPEGTMAYYEPWAQGPITRRPLKDWEGESERPLTMELTNGLTVSLGEARMADYTRTKFALEKENTLRTSMYNCADVMTPYDTPWRVVMAAERPVDLIAHNYIYLNLNDANELKGDLSWIKPGKAYRCTSLTQKDALQAVDFAAERGFQYVHLDAGWYGPEMLMSSDATSVAENKDLDMPALCRYAASKGIGIFVYVNQRALYQQLDEILPLYKQWGIKGIKFGFVQIGNQHWTIWLHNAIRKCAEYGLMVDIHDEYRPTGISRTLPNLMTQEGVRGNEEMPDAKHNTTLPFTRMLCGGADYTPCYFNQRVKNTFAHQLALPVVYYSPITFLFWYDSPALYQGEKELEFWKHVPTTWDETYPVDGQIGEYVVMARRSGDKWFVGAINGLEARKLTMPTDFLEKGEKYRMTLYRDNLKLKTRTKVETLTKTIKGGEKIKIDMAASGGTAIEFEPLSSHIGLKE